MKQKFRKLTFVEVADKMPLSMSHFDKGFLAIVDGTYSQLYGGDDINSYCLYKVDEDKDGKMKIVNHISWYKKDQLIEVPNQDRLRAEELIEEYNMRNTPKKIRLSKDE